MGSKTRDETFKVRRPFAGGLIKIVGANMNRNRSMKTYKRLMSLPLTTSEKCNLPEMTR